MIFQEYSDHPENYLFRYVLNDHLEDYLVQGWEVIGMMQNTRYAINSVTSFVMAIKIK